MEKGDDHPPPKHKCMNVIVLIFMDDFAYYWDFPGDFIINGVIDLFVTLFLVGDDG